MYGGSAYAKRTTPAGTVEPLTRPTPGRVLEPEPSESVGSSGAPSAKFFAVMVVPPITPDVHTRSPYRQRPRVRRKSGTALATSPQVRYGDTQESPPIGPLTSRY